MFPFIRDSGPFLNLLPFPTAGSGFVTVTNGTVSISGTQITLPATSSGSLVGAVYGVEFGIGQPQAEQQEQARFVSFLLKHALRVLLAK